MVDNPEEEPMCDDDHTESAEVPAAPHPHAPRGCEQVPVAHEGDFWAKIGFMLSCKISMNAMENRLDTRIQTEGEERKRESEDTNQKFTVVLDRIKNLESRLAKSGTEWNVGQHKQSIDEEVWGEAACGSQIDDVKKRRRAHDERRRGCGCGGLRCHRC